MFFHFWVEVVLSASPDFSILATNVETGQAALKVSLLLPFESVRNYALENFDRKLKSVVIEGKVINNSCLSEKGTIYIDECLEGVPSIA